MPPSRNRTNPSAAIRFSISNMRDLAISARLDPYILDGSKSIIVSITSSGRVIVNEVLPEAVAMRTYSTMSRQYLYIVVHCCCKSESTPRLMFAWIKKPPT